MHVVEQYGAIYNNFRFLVSGTFDVHLLADNNKTKLLHSMNN